MLVGRQILPGNVEWDAEGLGVFLEVGEPAAVFWAVPGIDRSVIQGQCFVGDDEVQVEVDGVAEALAAGAGAKGIVEAEEARFGLGGGTMAGAALEGGGEAVELVRSAAFRIARGTSS